MEKKELTKEMLLGAADDLNKVLELKPPIVTEFASSLKGAALTAAEKKFTDQLGKDLIEVATCSDEQGKLLLQPTDVLQSTTIDVLETLGVEGIREKVGSPDKKVSSAKNGKARKADKVKMSEKAPSEADKPKADKPKADKPKAKVKDDKKEGKNDWGHRLGSQSAKIDEAVKRAVAKGKVLETDALAKETNLPSSRITMHLKHLKERKLIKE